MSNFTKIKKVLVANRGEIACRIIRCCKENGLKTIAIFSSEDADSAHVIQADESHLISGIGATAYIDSDQIVQVAIDSKADVVVPGYGFLSENSAFAESLAKNKIVFAGPSAESVEIFGLKHSARELAEKNEVPVLPGSNLIDNEHDAITVANKIGYPIIIKSTAGGGGMGLRVCHHESNLKELLKEVISRSETLFKNSGVFIEKYVEHGRHIEIQIFGNGKGDVITFGERECSIQRRHQKVIEEAPSPFISLPKYNHKALRNMLSKCSIQLASSIKYKSAGTVEYLVDDISGEFYFLEMNTRLQVEHGITELIYNVDLLKLMLLQAEYELRGESGLPLSILQSEGSYEVDSDGFAIPQGHAIECRVYAENPVKNFQPSPGILHYVNFPKEIENCKVRIDHWISSGNKVSPYFDPLLAKVMVWATNRLEATNGMIQLLNLTKIQGPPINIDYLSDILKSDDYALGNTLTSFLSTSFEYSPKLLEFMQPGSYTTVQDLPGRESYSAGIPLSGPVDPLSLQIANLIVGNDRQIEALEITFKGPVIKFHSAATICLAGGSYSFKLGREELPMFTAITIPANSIVKIGEPSGEAARAYLAIKGGFPDVAHYLGSKSCTPTLNLGGHQGRVIMAGDCLTIEAQINVEKVKFGFELPEYCKPDLNKLTDEDVWTIRMISGPHDSSEIVSKEGLKMLYNTIYTVNLNSNRGCTKLDGPSNIFSRSDGRDGGSHPSNILEYPYPTCGLSVVGSVMSLFGVDGGTLSGFTCVSVPIESDWWKVGQAKIGGKIRFQPVTYGDALKLSNDREAFFNNLENAIRLGVNFPKFIDHLEKYDTSDEKLFDTILYERAETDDLPKFNIRQAGEKMVIYDFGIEKFTLLNNGRQRALEIAIKSYDADSNFQRSIIKIECASGAAAILFDTKKISREEFISVLSGLEAKVPPPHGLKVKSTLYKIPCSFDHSALTHCIERYIHSQRPHAPYLPDNVKYVMEANCIKLIEEFKLNIIGQTQVVTAVSFLCANTLSVNLDPRTRFKTGKFNPARTFTPKGAIGSGSVGHSIYSIDSPGGYMIWGMTLPDLCWNTFSRLNINKEGEPWFFNNFDQIVYYEVDEAKLNELNNQLITGKYELESENVEFDFGEYVDFLKRIEEETNSLNALKTEATLKLVQEEELSMNKWLGEIEAAKEVSKSSKNNDVLNDPSIIKVISTMAANIFKINYKKGSKVTSEDILIVLEAMKMEIAIRPINEIDSDDEDSEASLKSTGSDIGNYEVVEVIVDEGDVVGPGDTLAFIKAL